MKTHALDTRGEQTLQGKVSHGCAYLSGLSFLASREFPYFPTGSFTYNINKRYLFHGTHHFSVSSMGRVSLIILAALWPEVEVQEDIICKTCESEKL